MSSMGLSDFQKNLVFINNVDSYNGKYLAENISKLVYESAVELPVVEDYGEDGPPAGPGDAPDVQEVPSAPLLPPPESDDAFPSLHYEVIGNVMDRFVKDLPGVKTIISPEKYLKSALGCGVLILDISQSFEGIDKVDEILRQLDQVLTQEEENLLQGDDGEFFNAKPSIRRIILISTVLTWSATKLENSEEGQILNEDHYEQRAAIDAYKAHYAIEENLLKLGNKFKNNLQIVIVSSGLSYGCEESLFFIFFQMAWENVRVIPIFGNGQNNLPVIHVKDLSRIVGSFLQSFPQTKKMILAVEKNVVKLQDIILLIGKSYGSGYFQYIPKEEVIFISGITSHMYFQLTANLIMEPLYINQNEEVVQEERKQWTHTASFLEDMEIINEEFKDCLHLKPHKILLFGPPASGKSKLAMNLSVYYGIPTYSEEILNELIVEELKWKLDFYSNLKPEGEDPSIEMEGKGFFTEHEESVEDIKADLVNVQGKPVLPKEMLIKFLQRKVSSLESKNKGWIFEGYPKLYEECITIFGEIHNEDSADANNDEVDGEDAEEKPVNVKLPDLVISLEAPDLFLCERVMLQRENAIFNLPYNERDMLKNLKDFRKMVSVDETLLTYFEDARVEIRKMNLDEKGMTMETIFDMIVEEIGEASSTFTKEELETASEIEERIQKAESERIVQIKKSIAKDNEDKIKQWTRLYKILKQEEAERIRVHSDALRQYLMKYVFPLLTKGLAMVAKVRPADPIDFLAEYLFRENASGKIFDPGYNFCADHLMVLFDEINRYVNGRVS